MGNNNTADVDNKDNDNDDNKKILEQTVEEKLSTYNNPVFPAPSKEVMLKFLAMAEDLGSNGDFYKSHYFLDLIPKDPKWCFAPLQLKNATQSKHIKLLDEFVIPDDNHKYLNDVKEGIKLFNKWRKWKHGQEWKYNKTDKNIKIYKHSEINQNIDIVKGEGLLPYSTPIIAGVLLNEEHRQKYDKSAGKLDVIEAMSLFSYSLYLTIKTPWIIADRDIVIIHFVYAFRDGSFIMGSRSISHDKYPVTSTPVRANILLNLWHIRPDYNKNIQNTRITYYMQMDLAGSLPYSTINTSQLDMPRDAINNINDYIKSIKHELHLPGMLHIPPFPVLKNLGVDVGWMDVEIEKNQYKSTAGQIATGTLGDDQNDNDNQTDDNTATVGADVATNDKILFVTKEYVLKAIDKDNENKIICFDADFNDISFELNDNQQDLKKQINDIIDEGKKQKKDVIIVVVEKDNQQIVSDVKI